MQAVRALKEKFRGAKARWQVMAAATALAMFAGDASAISIPYTMNFDSGTAGAMLLTGGATGQVQSSQCWRGSCLKLTPSTEDNTYAALGEYMFPATQRIHVRYLMYFGPDFVNNIDLRMKHLIIHRGTDTSGDRAMVYLWKDNAGDMTMGVCDNNDCRYEGGKVRPDGTESFSIREHLQEWVAFEAVFDAAAHTVSLYVSTQDGRLNQHLLATRAIHAVSSGLDHWDRISVIGAFVDLGTTRSAGMYWMLDEVQIGTSRIGPPEGFFGVRPRPPTGVVAE